MRRGVLAAGAAIAAVLAGGLGPAVANSAVRSSAGSDATVTSVACASDGSCAAGGRYTDSTFHSHAFVLTGKNGQWGTAVAVPGLAALKPQGAGIDSVSCAAGGGCAAAGTFADAAKRIHVFVTSERGGRWSRLTQVFTGPKSENSVALSCPAAASCAAVGGRAPFAVSETRGRWGRATRFASTGQAAPVYVSCASAGDCSAGWGKFVVSERNGRWGKPAAVPGLAALGSGEITSIACTAAPNCAVGGRYLRKDDASEAFVATRQGGRWGKAIEVPGFTALNTEGGGVLKSVACLSAGNCVAGGFYAASADFQGGAFEPFVASERQGRWGKAIEVPGIPAPSSAICEPDSDSCVAGQVLSVSCSAQAGTCTAGGWYDTTAIDGLAAFVTSYRNGRWAKVSQVPGLEALDTGRSSKVYSVSCGPSGRCAAGGSYSAGQPNVGPAFVTFEKNGNWSPAQTVRF